MAMNASVTHNECSTNPLKKLSITEVNKMSFTDFTQTFGSVIEHTPLVAASVWSNAPFTDLNSLHRAFTTFIGDLNEITKVGMLRCFPDLAGKLAHSGALSSDSTREHNTAGLLDLSVQEQVELTDMNDQYKEKFNFPFVVCARENKKDSIMKGIRNRLGNSARDERECGIGEICKIAWYRLADLVEQDNKQCTSDCKL